jgi:D-alanyl-D-alanine carboxypeptidase
MGVDQPGLLRALTDTGMDHGPGLFGLVVDDGEVVFSAAVGVADLADHRPIEARDSYRVGSLTKIYVATLVLQLIGDGVLALTDTVQRWLPDAVPQADRITVELLLRMRSGLPDYAAAVLGDPPDLGALQRYWSPETLVRTALGSGDQQAPDSVHRYCNTDYVLLGLIVERATGERLEAQLWKRIFVPLRLDSTTFPTVDPHLRGPHATGYHRASPDAPYTDCTVLSPSESWAAGAIVATPGDVAAFFDGLFTGAVLDPSGLALLTEGREPLDGWRSRGIAMVRYEFGNGVTAFGGHGGVPGYTTVALRTTTGRCVVLYQNGIDLHDVLTSDNPFIATAIST